MRRPILAAVLATLAIAAGTAMVLRPTTQYFVPAADAQARIDQRLPISGERMGATYAVKDLDLTLGDDGRAGVEALVDLSGAGRAMSFRAQGTVRPTYAEGKFYLSDVELHDMQILSLQEKHGALGAIGRMANRLVDEGIVDASSLDAVKDRAIGIGREALVVAIEGRPVYDLSNGTVKGEVASMALRELKVSSAGITAALDPFGVVVKILAYALIGILAMAAGIAFVAAMFRSGGTGLAIGTGLSLFD